MKDDIFLQTNSGLCTNFGTRAFEYQKREDPAGDNAS